VAANDKGIIFRVNGDGSDYQIEYEFDQLSGYGPEGSLCLAPNGKLYGMTNLGGEAPGSPAGTLFKFDLGGGGFTKLVDFDLLGGNGAFGWGTMIVASDGMLYGATYGGGGSGGSIFRLDPTNDNYTIVEVLDQATGRWLHHRRAHPGQRWQALRHGCVRRREQRRRCLQL
jgi:uncharacterized repeat protein (TIGR03803 family)